MTKILSILVVVSLLISGYFLYLEPKIKFENLVSSLQTDKDINVFFDEPQKFKDLSDNQKLKILSLVSEIVNDLSSKGNINEINKVVNAKNKLNDNIEFFLDTNHENHIEIVKILAENNLLDIYEKNQSRFSGVFDTDSETKFNNLNLISNYFYSTRTGDTENQYPYDSTDFLKSGILNFELNDNQKYDIFKKLYGEYSQEIDLIDTPLAFKLLSTKTQLEYIYSYNSDPYKIYTNFEKFDIDPSKHLEVFKHLIINFPDSSYLGNYFENFYGIPESEHYNLAVFLIENENPSIVGDHLQKFKGIKKDQHQDIAERILNAYNSYYSGSIARNIVSFNGLDTDSKFKIAARIINRDKEDWRSGRNSDLARNLYLFNLSNDQTIMILKELSLLGYKDDILSNILFYPPELIEEIRNLPTN